MSPKQFILVLHHLKFVNSKEELAGAIKNVGTNSIKETGIKSQQNKLYNEPGSVVFLFTEIFCGFAPACLVERN